MIDFGKDIVNRQVNVTFDSTKRYILVIGDR
jgi:hypothetical protein